MEISNSEVYQSENPSETGNQDHIVSDLEYGSTAKSQTPHTTHLSDNDNTLVGQNGANDESESEDDVYDESMDEETGEEEDDNAEDEEAMDGDIPDPARQKKIMKLLENDHSPLAEGDMWYLISAEWFRRWKQYVNYDWSAPGTVSRPGPITNEGLLEPNSDRVQKNLIEHTHFAIISEKEWKHLVSWYGGGPEIARPVISTSSYSKTVEVRRLDVRFIKSSESQKEITHEFSKVTTVKKMKEVMCPILEVEPENVRMWDYHNKQRSQLLENPDKTLSEYTIINNQFILFEEKQENGEWPPKPVTNQWRSGTSYTYSHQNLGKQPTDPGLCGLQNLGNTCFMNSSLQCLSNSPLLTNFFLTNQYKADINRNNPLGTGGKLVEQYASLLKDMWSGEYKYIAPRDFKYKLETFAPQFQGMQQHDSQELLGYLLDGLHEDLNRVKNKPYVELKEAEGREDSIVAEEAWSNHLARNDSIIVDWYQGQLKSKLTCPDCDRVSVTFDPCMYLSLPLPVENTRALKVTIVLEDPTSVPIERLITVPKDGCISDLKNVVSELYQVPTENLAVIEVWNSKIYKVFSLTETIEQIQERDDIRIFHVSAPEKRVLADEETENEEKEKPKGYGGYGGGYGYGGYKPKPRIVEHSDDIIHLAVVLRKQERAVGYTNHTNWGCFGNPFIIAVRRGISYEELHNIIAFKIQRFFDDPSILEFPRELLRQEQVQEQEDLSSDDSETQPMEIQKLDGHNSDESSTKINNADTGKEVENEDNANKQVNNAAAEPTNNSTVTQNNPTEGETRNNPEGEEDENDKGLNDDESDEQDTEKSEEEQIQPKFVLAIFDSGNRITRSLEYDQPANFGSVLRESLSVCFSDDLLTQFKQTEVSRVDNQVIDALFDSEDSSIDISDCLELYTAEEQLGPDDPWYCNKCKDFKQATKKFDFWKFPPLLVIHLKRFSYKNRYRRDKIESVVKFPLTNLDLSAHMLRPSDVPPIYDLMAVSNHFGALGGGHYTAFAKNHNDNKWYKFDDSSVSPVNDESKICSAAAYVLFYRRKDIATEKLEKLKYSPSPSPAATEEESSDAEDDHSENGRRSPSEDSEEPPRSTAFDRDESEDQTAVENSTQTTEWKTEDSEPDETQPMAEDDIQMGDADLD